MKKNAVVIIVTSAILLICGGFSIFAFWFLTNFAPQAETPAISEASAAPEAIEATEVTSEAPEGSVNGFNFSPTLDRMDTEYYVDQICGDLANWTSSPEGLNVVRYFDSSVNPTRVTMLVSPTVEINGFVVMFGANGTEVLGPNGVRIDQNIDPEYWNQGVGPAIKKVQFTTLNLSFNLELYEGGYNTWNYRCTIEP